VATIGAMAARGTQILPTRHIAAPTATTATTTKGVDPPALARQQWWRGVDNHKGTGSGSAAAGEAAAAATGVMTQPPLT